MEEKSTQTNSKTLSPVDIFFQIKHNQTQLIDDLRLYRHLDFRERNKKGMSYLKYAIYKRNDLYSEFLINKKIDLSSHFENKEAFLSIIWAIDTKMTVFLDKIIDNCLDVIKAFDLNQALMYAIHKVNSQAVNLLISKIIDLKFHFNSFYLSGMTFDKNLESFINRRFDFNFRCIYKLTPFMWAIEKRNDEIIDLIIKNEYNLNFQDHLGRSLLMFAIDKQNKRISKLLIKKEVDFNAQNNKGHTVLMCAIYRGSYSIAQLLINKERVDLNLQDHCGNTALILSIEKGHDIITQLLINKNVNFDIQNKQGNTALMFAIYKGNNTLAEILISRNADINIKNYKGITALMWAIRKFNYHIGQTLFNINEGLLYCKFAWNFDSYLSWKKKDLDLKYKYIFYL